MKPKRIVIASGTLKSSLLSAWIDCGKGVREQPLYLDEKVLMETYHKPVRLILEVMGDR